MECVFRNIITIIDKPTLTSAAATTIIKNTNNCPSVPAEASVVALARWCILENATNNKLTALSISSMHINTIMTLRRVRTPIMPITKSEMDRNM